MAPEVEAPPKVVNLMEALRKSLDTISARRRSRRRPPVAGCQRQEKAGVDGWAHAIQDSHAGDPLSRSLADRARPLPSPAAAQNRGVTAEDYFAFETLGDPHFSPDGSTIAFVVTTVDQKQNRRRSEIWSVPADGSRRADRVDDGAAVVEQPAMEPGRQGDRVPVGAADAGRRGRPTRRARRSGCCRSAAASRAASPTCSTACPASQWSPDGSRLVVVGRSGPSDTAKSPSDVRHYTHANYKFNDTGWFDDKRTHSVVVDVASAARSTQITSGDDWNDTRSAVVARRPRRSRSSPTAPGKEFDEGHNTRRLGDRRDRRRADEDLRSRHEPTALRAGRPTARRSRSSARATERAHPKIWLAPATGGAPSRSRRTASILIPAALRWAADGKALYFETGVKGAQHLFRVDLAERKASPVTSGDRTVHLVDVNDKTGRLAYAVNDPTHLDDLYVADLDGRNEKAAHASQRRAVEAAAARRRSSACRSKAPTAGTSTASS